MQTRVQPASRKQLRVRTAFDDRAAIEHEDLLRVPGVDEDNRGYLHPFDESRHRAARVERAKAAPVSRQVTSAGAGAGEATA